MIRRTPITLLLNCAFFILAHQCVRAEEKVDFNLQIRPLLSDRCWKCHGPDEKSRKAKLRLDTKEGALGKAKEGGFVIKPSAPSESEVYRRITSTDPDEQMPPPECSQWQDQNPRPRAPQSEDCSFATWNGVKALVNQSFE